MGEKPLFIHVYIKERVMINETTKFRNLVISAMSELGEFESDTEWKMVEEYSGDVADKKNPNWRRETQSLLLNKIISKKE